ncbi:hypothetical protein DIPPA_02566 [Diplonema papillatum]|nr:hypothetical protein DIPPA_02566 [Diplonema papillatum]
MRRTLNLWAAARCVVPDPSCIETVSGQQIEGIAVYRNFVSASEELALGDEGGDWMRTKHVRGWGHYRSASKKSLVNTVDFFGRHTHTGKALITLASDPSITRETIAVQHAPQALRLCPELGRAGIIPTHATAFAYVELPYPDSGNLLSRPPKWHGQYYCLVSLLADTVLVFKDVASLSETRVLVPSRALLHCTGQALTWQHGVPFESPVRFKGKPMAKDYSMHLVYYSVDMELVDVSDA